MNYISIVNFFQLYDLEVSIIGYTSYIIKPWHKHIFSFEVMTRVIFPGNNLDQYIPRSEKYWGIS